MKILSLDISSATIGWASLENSGTIGLLDYGHIKPLTKKKADGNLSLRLKDTRNKIEAMIKEQQPELIIIEDYAKKFSSGRSSANTIILLAVFNETVALSCYDYNGKSVERATVRTLRSYMEKKFKVDLKGKEDVIKFVKSYFDDKFTITLNRNNNIKKECEDEADAIILGLYYLLKEEGPNA